MAYVICAALLLGAVALLLSNVIQERLRQQRVMQRLDALEQHAPVGAQ